MTRPIESRLHDSAADTFQILRSAENLEDAANDACDGLQIGDLVDGRYELLEPISAGAFGVVFQARQTVTGQVVALKLMHAHTCNDPELRARTAREGRLAGSIRHENIVTVLDAGSTPDGRIFIAMELLDGPTLRGWLHERGRPTLLEVAALARKIASAIAAAHRAGVVHRDLKPDNIIVLAGPTGPTPKVLDFGLAAVVEPSRAASRFTAVGTVLGTYAYMSPEQASGAAAKPAFDIYAFGVLLHLLLTGELPFTGDSESSLLYAKMTGHLDETALDTANVPERWRKLVRACLELDARARPDAQTIVRMIDVLRDGSSMMSAAKRGLLARPRLVLAATAALPAALAVSPAMLEIRDPTPHTLEHIVHPDEIVQAWVATPTPHAAPEQSTATAVPPANRRVLKARKRGATESDDCPVATEALESSIDDYRWGRVLQLLDAHACWRRAEAEKWRMKALLELRRFDECARLGAKTTDAEMLRWRTVCERRAAMALEQGSKTDTGP